MRRNCDGCACSFGERCWALAYLKEQYPDRVCGVNILGDFLLITGAGVTEETAAQALPCCDGVIVDSWLKEHHDARGEVNEAYVRAFVQAAKG